MYNVIVGMKRIILLLWISCIPVQIVFSQHSSRDGYAGNWEDPTTWNPSWSLPQTNISGFSITINGYVSLNSNLTFTGIAGNLIVNDTLVITGDLILGNKNNLSIADKGILIVRGSFTINNETNITSNGYLIITGNIIKLGSNHHGSFTSNDNPPNVFIGGSTTSLGNSEPNYPVLNCPAQHSSPYTNSHCSYGNMTDIISDPIFSFFQSSCNNEVPTVTSSGPLTFCKGNEVTLLSTGGSGYLWSNGETTHSIIVSETGSYTVKVTNSQGCLSLVSKPAVVTVNPLPPVPAISAGGPLTFCFGGNVVLTADSGTAYLWSTGAISPNINVTSAGNYTVRITNANGCQSMVSEAAKVVVNDQPIAIAGPDQELKYIFETKMAAELSSPGTGEWSLISGSGHIADIHSPTTMVTELSVGENIFLWKTKNGNCEAAAHVKITVFSLFIPSVITPDGDGKNDYFKISESEDRVSLIIFNRWGNEEYTNTNYSNNWDGRNNRGAELPSDTYFYILKFGNGKIYKGSVLIKR
jgi:gliding motility-associated-like protein